MRSGRSTGSSPSPSRKFMVSCLPAGMSSLKNGSSVRVSTTTIVTGRISEET
jgi:hypothetical protein